MRRLFWLAMGVTIGVLVVRKLQAAAEKLTPRGMASGLGQGLADLADAIRDFGADVREAMSEREAELRESTGLDGQLGHRPESGPPATV
jgi:chromosome condensin MukBEF MukE localization factor